ncbi:hypothetical protein U3A55_12065 [Salarchaeum sp. III]|uniref:hypothetical protein n=1 Tax=Salarchaeum sp. III TaxID=3107927 RepID=UPI002ED7F1C4
MPEAYCTDCSWDTSGDHIEVTDEMEEHAQKEHHDVKFGTPPVADGGLERADPSEVDRDSVLALADCPNCGENSLGTARVENAVYIAACSGCDHEVRHPVIATDDGHKVRTDLVPEDVPLAVADGGTCSECGASLPEEIDEGTGVYCSECGHGQLVADGGLSLDCRFVASQSGTVHERDEWAGDAHDYEHHPKCGQRLPPESNWQRVNADSPEDIADRFDLRFCTNCFENANQLNKRRRAITDGSGSKYTNPTGDGYEGTYRVRSRGCSINVGTLGFTPGTEFAAMKPDERTLRVTTHDRPDAYDTRPEAQANGDLAIGQFVTHELGLNPGDDVRVYRVSDHTLDIVPAKDDPRLEDDYEVPDTDGEWGVEQTALDGGKPSGQTTVDGGIFRAGGDYRDD